MVLGEVFERFLDSSPVCVMLRAMMENVFAPVKLEMVSQAPSEPLWDSLVRQYHYLGYQNLLGHRLKYLAFTQDRPVAALSFSAPALKLRVRDHYIGWSFEQRKLYLKHLANNSRFLILPWVQIPHLASHVLALSIFKSRSGF